jgi:hypothetical protein
VEILVYDNSTKISSNLAPFDKISKSRDGRGRGGSFRTKAEEAMDKPYQLKVKLSS